MAITEGRGSKKETTSSELVGLKGRLGNLVAAGSGEMEVIKNEWQFNKLRIDLALLGRDDA